MNLPAETNFYQEFLIFKECVDGRKGIFNTLLTMSWYKNEIIKSWPVLYPHVPPPTSYAPGFEALFLNFSMHKRKSVVSLEFLDISQIFCKQEG